MAKRKANESAIVTKREHRMGKYMGYEVDGDRYFLAPDHVNNMASISADYHGLNDMVKAHNASLAPLFQSVAKRRERWWTRVMEDLGLSADIIWDYRFQDGSIGPAKPKAEQSKPEQE